MYIYPQWTFKKHFAVDPFTGLITKTSATVGIWNARAYYKDAFDYSLNSNLTEGTGIKVNHNVNPGEVTDYAVGFSNETYPNNVATPGQLCFGLHFHDGDIDVIKDGNTVFSATALNVEYFIEYETDQTLQVFYIEDNVRTNLFDCTTVVSSEKYHAHLLAATAQYTDLEVFIDFNGIKSIKIQDVTYFNDPDYISVYQETFDVPISTQIIRVLTEKPVYIDSLNNDSVKLYRYVPDAENPDIDKEEVNITVPYQWGSVNHFDIFTTAFQPGNVYQLAIGNDDHRLVAHTFWRMMIDNIESYDSQSNAEFMVTLYDAFFSRAPDTNYWETQLDGGAMTRVQVIEAFADSAEYQLDNNADLETPFEIKQAIFKTDGELPSVDEIELNQFFNDIYFKTRNLDTLIDVDAIVHEVADIFDYEYKVTEYDPETNTYNHVADPDKVAAGLEDTDLTLTFENSKIIEKLFVSQYLPEYAKYMTDLNDETVTIISAAEAENLKEILFKNITMMNYFKGNKIQMQFLISIFSSSIGYFYVSVDPDPYNNFIYRVSTSLPEKYWIDDIKDITHPLGWDDLYIYVPKDATAWHQMKIMTAEEFEDFWAMHSKLAPTSYIDIADYLDDDGNTMRFGNYAGNAMLDDLILSTEFPFKPTEYGVTIDYRNTSKVTAEDGLFHELRTQYQDVSVDENVFEPQIMTGDKSLFKFTNDGNGWNLEFLKSGIASEYIWKIYKGGSAIGSISTLVPKLKYKGDPNAVYEIQLNLKFKDFMMPLINYRLDNRNTKLMSANGVDKCEAYLDQSVNTFRRQHTAMLVGDSSSEKEYPIHDSKYRTALDLTQINSIIGTITIESNGTLREVFFNDEGTSVNLINGLFNRYKWIIRDSLDTSGDIIFVIYSNLPTINISLLGMNLEVVLINGDQEFIGPNIVL